VLNVFAYLLTELTDLQSVVDEQQGGGERSYGNKLAMARPEEVR